MIALPILLPDGFTSLLSVGDTVAIGQALAERTTSSEEVINIAEELGLPLHAVSKTLMKNPGESVNAGDILALKKHFPGWKKEAIVSKVQGTISRYERDTGKLVIQTSYQSLTENIPSPVDGVVALCDNEKIVINTNKNIAAAIASSGKSAVGEIFILEESFTGEATDSLVFRLGSGAVGKIVVAGALPREALMKGIGMGGVGVIASNIAEEDMAYLGQKNISTPVMAINHDILKKLVMWKGKKVFMDAPSKSIIFLHG